MTFSEYLKNFSSDPFIGPTILKLCIIADKITGSVLLSNLLIIPLFFAATTAPLLVCIWAIQHVPVGIFTIDLLLSLLSLFPLLTVVTAYSFATMFAVIHTSAEERLNKVAKRFSPSIYRWLTKLAPERLKEYCSKAIDYIAIRTWLPSVFTFTFLVSHPVSAVLIFLGLAGESMHIEKLQRDMHKKSNGSQASEDVEHLLSILGEDKYKFASICNIASNSLNRALQAQPEGQFRQTFNALVTFILSLNQLPAAIQNHKYIMIIKSLHQQGEPLGIPTGVRIKTIGVLSEQQIRAVSAIVLMLTKLNEIVSPPMLQIKDREYSYSETLQRSLTNVYDRTKTNIGWCLSPDRVTNVQDQLKTNMAWYFSADDDFEPAFQRAENRF